eukprot:jgi/Mesen1/10166/ME000076S09674
MTSLFDNASNLLTNVLSGGTMGNMPVAEGAVSDLFGRPLFFALFDWFMEGLIPADIETWKTRRRAIVPAFHAAYLEAMVGVFSSCADRTIEKLDNLLQQQQQAQAADVAGGDHASGGGAIRVEMEAEYSSLALDIIGISVFNYDFGSVTKESPIIQAVYGTLYEAEHRSTFYLPYWKIPGARQVKFRADLKVINDCLDELIANARNTRQEEDMEALQQRDYSKVKDASLLRFLVDMRGEDCNNRQLRDDLMTMLIAGHETTASVLTWATFMLAQNPRVVAKAQKEIDEVIGDRRPTLEDLKKLQYVRFIVAESLRLYPQPPLLIRRSLAPDLLPGVYNIHRSPHFWDNADAFDPDRFYRSKSPGDIKGWEGYDPERAVGSLYPNETSADYAFLPFGGGPRKCVGDQFALMESTVGLAMLLRRFDITLAGAPEDVELVTGATIHTKAGLWCKVKRRSDVGSPTEPQAQQAAAAAEAAAAAVSSDSGGDSDSCYLAMPSGCGATAAGAGTAGRA